MVPGESYDLDALVALTGLDGPSILARLTELELAGIVAVSRRPITSAGPDAAASPAGNGTPGGDVYRLTRGAVPGVR